MKRGRRNADVLTLDRRVFLKASFDAGEVDIINPETDEAQTYQEVLKRPDAFFTHSPKLGSGVYGHVKALKDESGNDVAVMKIAGLSPDLYGYTHSPFRSEQNEHRILNALWDELVITNITPHIVAPYGTHRLVNAVTSDQQRQHGVDMEKSVVSFMEKASAKTLCYFLGYTTKVHFDMHCKALLFQMAYTLGAIFTRWPKFRYNDFKPDNVLLNHSNDTGCVRYTIYGKTFYVPCIGVIALLSDFDFACIAGDQFDNFKVIEQSWDTPSYTINARTNHYADFYTMIQYIRVAYQEKMSDTFKAQLEELYGVFQKSARNSYHIMPGEVTPTVKELLLESDLFCDFREPKGTIRASYCVPVATAAAPPAVIAEKYPGDARHCPILRPRNLRSKVVNASLAFFSRLNAHPDSHDNDEGDVFSEPIATRLLDVIQDVYNHVGDNENDLPRHALPPDECDDCMELVASIAQRFIETFHVPFRWWCAVYSCAFVDACFELAVIPKGQRCWKLEDWCFYWKECGETIYSPTQMLHFALQWEWLVR